MPTIIATMLLVVLVCLAVLALVVVGLRGRGHARAPRLAEHLAIAARHLNGEAQPVTIERHPELPR